MIPRAKEYPPGTLIAGSYEIEKLLGQGAFATVYAARAQDSHASRVALKVLHPDKARQTNIRVRFDRRELTLLRRIHEQPVPNVVRPLVPRVLVHEGLPLLVLELIQGPTLWEFMKTNGPLPIDRVIDISHRLVSGLMAIHAAMGIHRDLKPSNIRLRHGTDPVILDLGMAKALWQTRSTTEGTPTFLTHSYAAPEHLASGKTTPASDVYALGLIVYEMLTGQVPLVGTNLAETRSLRLREAVPRLALHAGAAGDILARLVQRCLLREPRRRPSAAEIAQTLQALCLDRTSSHPARLSKTLLRVAFFSTLIFQGSSDMSPAWVPLDKPIEVVPRERPVIKIPPCIRRDGDCPPPSNSE